MIGIAAAAREPSLPIRAALVGMLILGLLSSAALAQADPSTTSPAAPRPGAGNAATPRAVPSPPVTPPPGESPAGTGAASATPPAAAAPPQPVLPVPAAPSPRDASGIPPAPAPAPPAAPPSTVSPAAPAEASPPSPQPDRAATPPADAAAACAASRKTLEDARGGGDLPKAVTAYGEMTKPEAGCDPKLLFCQGRALALMHLEQAYAAADKGDVPGATKLLTEARKFGEPWPLLVALGDDETAKAHAGHDPKDWGSASLDYQKAVLALAEPVLCDDEPARPAPAVIESLYRKMSAALMLGEPIEFARTKCDPCAIAFLGASAGFTPRGQPLPIAFEGRTAKITPAGTEAAKALIGCVLARKIQQVKLSVHTDNFGSAAVNKEMAQARVETLKKLFADGGFGGTVEVEALGKAEPFVPDEPKSFTADERARLNRRVELRSPLAQDAATCQ